MVVGGRERVARKLAAETRYLIKFCTNLKRSAHPRKLNRMPCIHHFLSSFILKS